MSITINRTFAFTSEEVFDGLTDPASFAEWFGTSAVTIPLETLSYDAQVGKDWTATMVLPDGSTKDWEGHFVEVERPSRFVFTMTDEPGHPARSPITFVLTPEGDHTDVVMTQEGVEHFDPEQLDALTAGWNAFLDSLSEILSRRD